MLLLMVQTDFDDLENALRIRWRHLLDEPLDRTIDMRAIGRDVIAIRPRDQTALRPRMTGPSGDIVGVEQEGKTLVENLVGRDMRDQHELFEEPRHVGAVPFG